MFLINTYCKRLLLIQQFIILSFVDVIICLNGYIGIIDMLFYQINIIIYAPVNAYYYYEQNLNIYLYLRGFCVFKEPKLLDIGY